MGKIGLGYGSEWHLLRYLGRHRDRLDAAVRGVCGADAVIWRDFLFADDPRWRDAEWKGLDFLPASHKARCEWESLWPQSGNVQNWDALAKVSIGGADEWLLVEAKAHLGEITSSCGAKSSESRAQIGSVFSVVKESLGVPARSDWMRPYYQYCNRVAALHALNLHGAPARLLFIYFTGDWVGPSSRKCPRTAEDWSRALVKQDKHIALPRHHNLSGRIHKVFLDVGES